MPEFNKDEYQKSRELGNRGQGEIFLEHHTRINAYPHHNRETLRAKKRDSRHTTKSTPGRTTSREHRARVSEMVGRKEAGERERIMAKRKAALEIAGRR